MESILSTPYQFQTRSNHCGSYDIVDEECARVRKEDALPVQLVVLDQEVNVGLGGGEAKGGQDYHHEEQVPKCLLHDCMVLARPEMKTLHCNLQCIAQCVH